LRVDRRRLIVEGRAVRARDFDIGRLTPEEVFAVVLLWDAAETDISARAWIGWLTTTNDRSACFCAADLEDAGFRTWLDELPGWESERLTRAIEHQGLHLVWRRHSD
jgi:hypothetical protein